jgi:hypothetical protein
VAITVFAKLRYRPSSLPKNQTTEISFDRCGGEPWIRPTAETDRQQSNHSGKNMFPKMRLPTASGRISSGIRHRWRYNPEMEKKSNGPTPESLFPFILLARILIIGRDTLARSKSRLHFVLITRDITESSRAKILSDYKHYPVVQHYAMQDLENFFGIRGAKVIGFKKSSLAQSLYALLKEHRINKPVQEHSSEQSNL